MRAVILKARKLGFSTMAQGLLLAAHDAQAAAPRDHRRARSDDGRGDRGDGRADVPPSARRRGRRARAQAADRQPPTAEGDPLRRRPIASRASTNATSAPGTRRCWSTPRASSRPGRGQTFQSVHGSEVAFWPDLQAQARRRCSTPSPPTIPTRSSCWSPRPTATTSSRRSGTARSESGDFIPFFAAWHEDERYRRPLTRYEAEHLHDRRSRVRRGRARAGQALRARPSSSSTGGAGRSRTSASPI